MQIKILLPLLILLSFSFIVLLPASWDICVPNGCSFSNNVCNNNSCANETLGQHLGERTPLFNAVIKFRPFIIFLAVVLILFFALQKHLENENLISAKFYVKQKLLNSFCAKLFNYLIEIFSSGRLNPKIY